MHFMTSLQLWVLKGDRVWACFVAQGGSGINNNFSLSVALQVLMTCKLQDSSFTRKGPTFCLGCSGG